MRHWSDKYLTIYGREYDEVAYKDIVAQVRQNLKQLQSETPLVTISLIAHNEEKHLLACLWSLSEMKTKYSVEIIGVDNNSDDKTSDIYQAVGVPYFKEPRQSCGYARQCGLNHARGKYFVGIDSDTLYPPTYVDGMIDVLEKFSDVVAVQGTWNFFPTHINPYWQLWIYERLRNVYLRLQSICRPELCVRGMAFVHLTEEARKVGIRTHIIRGEDGALAFGLRRYGKIHFLYTNNVRVITGYGTVGDGRLIKRFFVRLKQILKHMHLFFIPAKEYKDKEYNLIKNKNQ